MTACRNKASRAVTAALVGVLSVGAVPMVALAQTDGASLFAVSTTDAWKGATIAAENGRGESVTIPEKDPVTFTEGTGEYLLPTSVTVDGKTLELDLKAGTGNAKVEYYEGSTASGPVYAQVGQDITSNLAKNADWKAGTYTAKVTYLEEGSLYKGQTATITFRIVNVSLADAEIFNASNENTNTEVTDFVWNGKEQEVGLAVDGSVVDEDDYVIEIFQGTSQLAGNEVKDAGSYSAYIYTKNSAGAKDDLVKTVPFTVQKLDLSKTTVAIGDVKVGDPAPTVAVANGYELKQGENGGFTISVVGDLTTSGECTATVSFDESKAGPNLKGNVATSSTVVKFNVVDALYDSDYQYDGTDIASLGGGTRTLTIDLAKGESFDESKVSVGGLTSKDFDVTYSDMFGNPVDGSALAKAGSYKVYVRVNAQRSDWAKGSGVHSFNVVVKAPVVGDADVTFRYDGEVTDSLFTTNESDPEYLVYDGSDFMEKITAEVRYGDKKLAEGDDYEVVILDESGKAVESIVDAGEYEVVIKSDSYKIDPSNVLEVKVNPINLKYLYAKSDLMRTFGPKTIIPYTGEDIDAGFTFGYYTKDGVQVKEGTSGATWNELPEAAVTVDGIRYDAEDLSSDGSWTAIEGEAVDALNDKGFYQLFVTIDPAVAVNYVYQGGADGAAVSDTVEVSDDKVFVDVDSNAYYAESVYTANSLGYIYGMGGTDTFAPNRSMSRADMAVMIFRMAGGELEQNDGKFDVDTSYLSKFSDVDENAYYAKAVAWATQVGVVSGYADGTFGPADSVTTEQFAVMLANYAKVAGKYEKVDVDATLAEVSDGSSVSAFAREQVAWAVENGYIAMGGAAISPQAEISRGRVVTIAVRYQPTQQTVIAPKPGDSFDDNEVAWR